MVLSSRSAVVWSGSWRRGWRRGRGRSPGGSWGRDVDTDGVQGDALEDGDREGGVAEVAAPGGELELEVPVEGLEGLSFGKTAHRNPAFDAPFDLERSLGAEDTFEDLDGGGLVPRAPLQGFVETLACVAEA